MIVYGNCVEILKRQTNVHGKVGQQQKSTVTVGVVERVGRNMVKVYISEPYEMFPEISRSALYIY